MADTKLLFDITSKGSRTIEKRVMLEIHATRQAYQRQEISNLGFVRFEDNLVDGFSKEKKQGALLQMMLGESHVTVCELWIIRNHQILSGLMKKR